MSNGGNLTVTNGKLVAEAEDTDSALTYGFNDLFPVLQKLAGNTLRCRDLEALKDEETNKRVARAIMAGGHFMTPEEAKYFRYVGNRFMLLSHEVVAAWGSIDPIEFEVPKMRTGTMQALRNLYSAHDEFRLIYYHGFSLKAMISFLKFSPKLSWLRNYVEDCLMVQ